MYNLQYSSKVGEQNTCNLDGLVLFPKGHLIKKDGGECFAPCLGAARRSAWTWKATGLHRPSETEPRGHNLELRGFRTPEQAQGPGENAYQMIL